MADATLHWFPLDLNEAEAYADTLDMEALDGGAYFFWLLYYWRHGFLPGSLKKVVRIGKLDGILSRSALAEMPIELAEVSAVMVVEDWLAKFGFERGEDGNWHNAKLDAKRNEQLTKMEQTSDKRRRAALSRWDRERDASAVDVHSSGNASAMQADAEERRQEENKEEEKKATDSKEGGVAIPLHSGKSYAVTEADYLRWERDAPNVNVRLEVSKLAESIALSRTKPPSLEEVNSKVLWWLGQPFASRHPPEQESATKIQQRRADRQAREAERERAEAERWWAEVPRWAESVGETPEEFVKARRPYMLKYKPVDMHPALT
jgi:hypothetical protein